MTYAESLILDRRWKYLDYKSLQNVGLENANSKGVKYSKIFEWIFLKKVI